MTVRRTPNLIAAAVLCAALLAGLIATPSIGGAEPGGTGSSAVAAKKKKKKKPVCGKKRKRKKKKAAPRTGTIAKKKKRKKVKPCPIPAPAPSVPPGLTPTGPSETAKFAISPDADDLGIAAVGGLGQVQLFTITNTGTATSGNLSTEVTGPDAGDFLIEFDTCAGTTLAVDGSCTLQMRFQPLAPGNRSALLAVSGAPGGTSSADLSGTGIAGGLEVSPADFAFDPVAVGTDSSVEEFTVTNNGSHPTGAMFTAFSGDFASFALAPGLDTCTDASLDPGEDCSIGVVFHPLASGPVSVALEVYGATANTVSSQISGVGASPELSISPEGWDYGPVQESGGIAEKEFTVTNTGAVSTPGPLSGGTTGTGFGTMPGDDDCSGRVLEPEESCAVTISFAPSSAGDHTGSLTFSAGPGAFAMVELSGTGANAALSITPEGWDYGPVQQSGGLAEKEFTVTNTGAVTTPGPVSGGTSGAGFGTIPGDDACSGQVLEPEESCAVTISFAPSSAGDHTGFLTFSAGPDVFATVELSGTGANAALSITPDEWNYGSVQIGSIAEQEFTVTNTGPVPTQGTLSGGTTGFAFGPVSGEDGCSGQVLEPAGSCSVTVGFGPSNTEHYLGSLTISAGAGIFAVAELSGVGTP
jgi:hypothetical protein